MLKGMIAELVFRNVESISFYQRAGDKNLAIVDDISGFIIKILEGLPWYYRLPIKILIFMTGIFSLVITRGGLDFISPQKHRIFFKYARFIPFFGTLQELIRSLAFLRLFDDIPYITDN